LKKGPVSVVIHSFTPGIRFFHSGIYNDKNCGPKADHAVLAVGFDS